MLHKPTSALGHANELEIPGEPQRRQGSKGKDSWPRMPVAWPSPWALSGSCSGGRPPGNREGPQGCQGTISFFHGKERPGEEALGTATPWAGLRGSPPPCSLPNPQRGGDFVLRKVLTSVPSKVPRHQRTGPRTQGLGARAAVTSLCCPGDLEPVCLSGVPGGPPGFFCP